VTDNARAVAILVSVAVLEIGEFFAIRREGFEVFPLKVGWRIWFYFFVTAGAVATIDSFLKSSFHNSDSWFSALLLAFGVLYRAQPAATNTQGLTAYRFWGLRQRFISWTDVFTVTSNWQEENTRFWRFSGYEVVVTGRDGTRIAHTIFLRKRAEFLDELRRYLPQAVFAPGVYAWHR